MNPPKVSHHHVMKLLTDAVASKTLRTNFAVSIWSRFRQNRLGGSGRFFLFFPDGRSVVMCRTKPLGEALLFLNMIKITGVGFGFLLTLRNSTLWPMLLYFSKTFGI